MRAGAEIIYQATFVRRRLAGARGLSSSASTSRPRWGAGATRRWTPSSRGPRSPPTCCSSASTPRRSPPSSSATPEAMHVLLGIGERRTLRHADFDAYYRRVRAGFLAALDQGSADRAVPRRALRAVRVPRGVRRALGAGGSPGAGGRHPARAGHAAAVGRRRRRSRSSRRRRRARGSLTSPPHTFETLHDQAEPAASTGGPPATSTWHALPVEAERGFERLPRPSPGDVVFDIEGDPFWEPARGLHFLFGLLTGRRRSWQYRAIWAHDRAGERQAFEALVDLFHERLARHPDMHVYHYGAYEPTALKQLMGVYATREDAVDELLRREVFVDLHAVVRQGLRAGRAELLAEGRRGAAGLPAARRDVTSGTRAVLAYEQWMDDARRRAARRDRGLQRGGLPRDARAARLAGRAPAGGRSLGRGARGAAGGRRQAEDRRRARGARARRCSRARRPDRRAGWRPSCSSTTGARRGPTWWWFFAAVPDVGRRAGRRRRGDRSARARGRAARVKRSLEHRFTLPAQQHKLAPGDHAVRSGHGQGRRRRSWSSTRRRACWSSGAARASASSCPAALDPTAADHDDRAASRARAPRRRDAGRRRPISRAARTSSRGRGRDSRRRHQRARSRRPISASSARRAAALDASYLFIQGPPGTGKTWTGARIVVDLIRRGRRVGVAATSHKAIHNLLDEIERGGARASASASAASRNPARGSGETEYASASITQRRRHATSS